MYLRRTVLSMLASLITLPLIRPGHAAVTKPPEVDTSQRVRQAIHLSKNQRNQLLEELSTMTPQAREQRLRALNLLA